MNTHPGCSGVVDTRRTTILGQWSHLMSGNGAPASFWASTEPGRPPFVYLPADHRRCRSERLEEEPLPACGLAALPGPSGEVPGQSMARPGLPQPGELKTDRIRPKSGRRVRKQGGRAWVARRRREEGAGQARVRVARLQWQRAGGRRRRGEEWGRVEWMRPEGGRGRIEKGPSCATDGRARGGHAQTTRASAWCPFHPKSGANLGRGWVESGHKADKSPFAPARWAVSFVPFTPNGRGRTG